MLVQPENGTPRVGDCATDSLLNRQVRVFFKRGNAAPCLESLPVDDVRMVLIYMQKSEEIDLSGIEVPQKTSLVRLQRDDQPRSSSWSEEELPVFIFTHEGRWSFGNFPTHQSMVRDLVAERGFTAVLVNYTRTPDSQFPQAINEIYAATK